MPTLLRLIKGWTFITLSAILIFFLSYVHHQQMTTTQTKLETANQQLQVLHRIFRHNIRNDLNVALGYSEMLSERVSDRQSESHLEIICQTINQIIDISEKLKIVENVDPALSDGNMVDFTDMIRTEIEALRDTYPDVTITTEVPDNARIQADESLRYAIREILENAIVHNTNPVPECELSINLNRVNGDVLLKISDNGPGIPREELQAFQTGQETPLVHASSVGLWLTTWLTRIHGGSIKYDTDDGTTVSLRFQSGTHAPLLNAGSVFSDQIESTKV